MPRPTVVPRVHHKKTLARIARSVPLRSRRQLLDAVLPQDLGDEALLAYTKRLKARSVGGQHPYHSILDEVCRVLLKGEEFLRRATLGQRQALGGVSMALLALTAHEGLDVLDLASQWEQELRREQLERQRDQAVQSEHRHGRERYKRTATDHRSECLRMCKEIRRLLDKVADRDARLGLGRKPRGRPSTDHIVGELGRLADLGESLIDHEVKAVRARAFLFGLNRAAVRGWRHRGEALLEAEAAFEEAVLEEDEREEAADDGEAVLKGVGAELDLATAKTVVLLTLVVDGFASGHRVERSVPRINTIIEARTLLSSGRKRRRGRRRPARKLQGLG